MRSYPTRNRRFSFAFSSFLVVLLGTFANWGTESLSTVYGQQGADLDYEWGWKKAEVEKAGEHFWPQYRGPLGTGHSATTASPPANWGEDINLAWKKPITGKAWSSPVVWGDDVYVTNASEDGLVMTALGIDRRAGDTLWEKVVFTNTETQPDFHVFNSYASPTPIVDSEYLYVTFGAYGTACLNRRTGETVWERRDLECNHFRGAGSSPIFFQNLLIFHMDGFDLQYVIALDRSTGKTVWKSERTHEYGTDNGDFKKAYGTPHIIEVLRSGRRELQLLSPAAKAMIAYDPETGKELWHVRHEEHSAALRPLFDGEMVYCSTGFSKGHLLAIDPAGRGDATGSHLRWRASRAIGAKPSPILIDDLIISLEDKGMLTAFRKQDGEQVWQIRLGGDFSSSPIVASGQLYCLDESGNGYVVSKDGVIMHTNRLESGCLASPAAVGEDLIIRTRDALYCFRR
jgi:outer membrane protein assembly factor BamB